MNHQELEREPFSYDFPDRGIDGLLLKIIDRPEATLHLPWELAWITYKGLQALGRVDSFHFVRATITMLSLVQAGAGKRLRFDDDLFYEVWEEVADTLHATDHEWKRELDQVLHFTYVLVRSHYISRDQAAAIASKILQQHVTPEAWRKRMERWAHAHGLPPVKLKRGRPPKYNSDTFG